jgi:glycosyltransferase involved in cell wall biosynthesis
MHNFSVIVAVCNIDKYIDQCLSSLCNQTYKNLEIIIVDDGSKDRSAYICDSWAKQDKRIKIVHKVNGGLSSARNVGLKVATGDYISYVDGDDWLDLNCFQKLSNYLSVIGDVDILSFSAKKYYRENYTEAIEFNFPEQKVVLGSIFFEQSAFQVPAWIRIYRKKFLENVNLEFLEGHLHEDISYTIPLTYMADKVAYLNDPLYFYRMNRDGSIMNEVKEQNVNNFIYALCFTYKFIKDNGKLTNNFEKFVRNSFYKSCLTHLTTYRILRRNMVFNDVHGMVKHMTVANAFDKSTNLFYIKLFFCHFYILFKYYGGRKIHYNRD